MIERTTTRQLDSNKRWTIRSLAFENIAIIASIGIVVVCAARIYFFSWFNLDLALAVMAITSRTQILASTLMVAVFLMYPIIFTWEPVSRFAFGGFGRQATLRQILRTSLLGVPMAVLALPLMSAFQAVLLAVTGVLEFLSHRRAAAQGSAGEAQPPAAIIKKRHIVLFNVLRVVVPVILGVYVLSLLMVPWLPEERIESAGHAPVRGYVIGEQSDRIFVVTDSREPQWLLTSSLERREVCEHQPNPLVEPLTTYFIGPKGTSC